MDSLSGRPSKDELHRAMTAVDRLGAGYSRIAAHTLGHGNTGNAAVAAIISIHRHPGISPSALAARQGVARAAVSRTLRGLREEGVVVGAPDPDDRRVVRLELSDAGRRRVRAFEVQARSHAAATADVVDEALEHLGAPPRRPARRRSLLATLRDLSGVGSAYMADFRPVAERLGLLDASLRTLLSAVREGAGLARPTDLVHGLLLTPASVTDRLDRLESWGLLERTKGDLEDGRGVTLSLTPPGERLVDESVRVLVPHVPALTDALRALSGATLGRESLTGARSR